MFPISTAVLGVLFGVLSQHPGRCYGLRDYCPWETFKASCGSDEVVVMEQARYGRMELGRCVRNDLGYVGCSTDVLDLADAACSGRHQCEIAVPNADLDKLKPCLEDLKGYLQASYKCRKVVTRTGLCRSSSNYMKLNSPNGVLSNIITMETGCGSSASPWIIEAKPGQRINITLHDFSLDHTSANKFLGSSGCVKYASLVEDDSRRSKTICGGERRRRTVYTSVGSSLEVQLHALPIDGKEPYFIIEYSVFGCPDPQLLEGTWYKREGNEAVIGCSENAGLAWRIVCHESTWRGQTGNCSDATAGTLGQVVIGAFTIPSGISIAIIALVSLLIGSIILTIGIVCLRRQQKRTRNSQPIQNIENDNYKQMVYTDYNKPVKESIEPCTTHQHKSRESNEYASIWEWPLPPTPSQAPPSYHSDRYYGTYRHRSDASDPDDSDHVYQYPDMGRASGPSEACEKSPRYFELDPLQNSSVVLQSSSVVIQSSNVVDKTGTSPLAGRGNQTLGYRVHNTSCPNVEERHNTSSYST